MSDSDAELISDLLARAPGYMIEVFGLSAYRTEGGKYVVFEGEENNQIEKSFDASEDAAIYFLERRQALQLGYEFGSRQP